jgi:hypothetical protein
MLLSRTNPAVCAGQRCHPSSKTHIAFIAHNPTSPQQAPHAAPAVLHWRQCCLPAAAVNSSVEVNKANSDAQQAQQQPGSTCLQDLMLWLVSNGRMLLPLMHILVQGANVLGNWQCASTGALLIVTYDRQASFRWLGPQLGSAATAASVAVAATRCLPISHTGLLAQLA